MITKFSQLDLTKQYTYADYLTWQFNERVELIKGWVLKMSPAPSNKHQIISRNITGELYPSLKNTNCALYVAPFDVRLFNAKKSTTDNKVTTVVQPDICIICDKTKIDDRGCLGAPDFIIEIISKGNTKKEVETKFDLYEENGVKEYWIVQQGDETVTVFDLVKGKYKFRKIYSNDSLIPIKILKNFEINLKEVFEN